jgi:hypothetical protein
LTDRVRFNFTKEQAKRIRDTLSAHNHNPAARKVSDFLHRVARMVSIYLAVERHERSIKKAVTRDHLDGLHKAIGKVADAYRHLDALGLRLLIYEHSSDSNEFWRQLEAMFVAGGRALGQANALPAKPRLLWRRWIACDLAGYMEDYLGIPPTGTTEGLFEQILGVVLEAATGRPLADPNKLACEALKIHRLQS